MKLSEIQAKVLKLIGEAQDTLVAAYLTGTNGGTSVAPLQTTADVITEHINDGQNDLARNYYPISDTGTYTGTPGQPVTQWPAGQQFARYSQFTCAGNPKNVVFGVRKVNFGGVNLKSSGRAATENWYPNMDTDAQGQPKLFYEDGIEGFGVYPIPAASAVATVKAIVTPAPLVMADDIPIFPVDLHVLLALYAAGMIILSNTEDPVLASHGTAYMGMYNDRAKRILDRVWRLDPDFARDLMAANGVAAAAPAQG